MKNITMTCAAALLLTACSTIPTQDRVSEEASPWTSAKEDGFAQQLHIVNVLPAELQQSVPTALEQRGVVAHKWVAVILSTWQNGKKEMTCSVYTVKPLSSSEANRVCNGDWQFQSNIVNQAVMNFSVDADEKWHLALW